MFRRLMVILMCLAASVSLGACGYSKEEKQRMKEIEALGRENAVAYVEEKYGFSPAVLDIRVCTSREDKDPLLWANGYVLASMSDGNKEFKVHISGERKTGEGQDDYQYDLIMEEAREYLENVLGYEIYDLYMEYREDREQEGRGPQCHENYLLSAVYQAGGFEQLLKQFPVNLRVDDCISQDFTGWKEREEEAADFFKAYAAEYGLKAVLISYRSPEDYDKGCSHTYGRGGLLDFDIEKDGMYICSYAAFDGEETDFCRFELQEREEMIFCCIDKAEGWDLQITAGEDVWMELGETRGEPVSKVYSADKEEPGAIVVYIPTQIYGRDVSVFIQHVYDGQWWQYEENIRLTKDKQYLIVTSLGGADSSFDFAVFK